MTISIDDTIVRRIERLEARAAIERLMADYAFGCDQKDVVPVCQSSLHLDNGAVEMQRRLTGIARLL
jgi:hypothetical protein